MKIAITARGAGLGAWIDNDFATCGQLVIVDDNNRFEAWSNPYRKETPEIAAEKIAKWIIEGNIPVLITKNISSQVKEILNQSGVRVIEAESGAVLDLVEQARQSIKTFKETSMKPVINKRKCPAQEMVCKVILACPCKAVSYVKDKKERLGGRIEINLEICNGCGICVSECCGQAIEILEG